MDRAEATGFGIAFAGHAALLALLAFGLATAKIPKPQADPIEVSFVDEVALESQSPSPTAEQPAAKLAEEEGPVEPSAPAPMPEPLPTPQVEPQPQPRVEPRPAPPVPAPTPRPTPKPAPAPKPVPQPKAQPPKPAPPRPAQPRPAPPKPAQARPAQPKAAQPKAAPKTAAPKAAPQRPNPKAASGSGGTQQKASPNARPTGRLSGLLNGINENPSQSRSTAPPAAKAGPAVQASLQRAIRDQLRPHWKSPTGADADQLRTLVTVRLSRTGAVIDVGDVQTTGITPSNRAQVKLHQEQALRAIRLAAPFRLPAEFYDAWKVIRPAFDKRLSQ
ncbi:cell envelope biogenesis protein TolA [Sphingosinicella sp. BN140058]|uniref:cell envelope biogenesis protein TolA n=1 Tax=Sphingosinicella sp. BN140058 TaxID=1892855 RepID=UPI0010134A7A|nr:cell envelope biogenesis protein TolA [Sphingosinicella sp. BN140058]QAY77132.1 cell envelope biogenesis protein TolA [Sphingosinicella sp. BN140058]